MTGEDITPKEVLFICMLLFIVLAPLYIIIFDFDAVTQIVKTSWPAILFGVFAGTILSLIRR